MHAKTQAGWSPPSAEDSQASQRLVLSHLLSLRQPTGWPVIGADQFIDELIEGAPADEYHVDHDRVWAFVRGDILESTTMLLLGGRIWFGYRMVVGAIPLRHCINNPGLQTAHPDWLWVLPGKHLAHSEITVHNAAGHYCGPPLVLQYARAIA